MTAQPPARRPGEPSGLFITFEGGEGAGKSTQVLRTLAWLQERSVPAIATREPGATQLGRGIRALLLEADLRCTPLAELFLLLADRAQHLNEEVVPALAAGQIVLCDRFTDSTLAYQAYGGELDAETVRLCAAAAADGLQPDLTLLLDIEPAHGFSRLQGKLDRMEQKGLSFHERVRKGFLAIARQNPQRVHIIDGSLPEEAAALRIQEILDRAIHDRI